MTGFSDYDAYDGLGLAELVHRSEVSPTELAEEAVLRLQRLNPSINAVVEFMGDRAREAMARGLPKGPFTGVPFLVKDLLAACAGVPMHCGSRFCSGVVPDYDSEIVRRYDAAGVVILGSTNTPELGLLPVTEPRLFGPTRNPWNLAHSSGGSSGGSAAAVAARIVPLAHGNDGGGSIRIPASCCGIFGLKPSRGRTPLGPDMHEAWQGMACQHVLSLTVRDSAAMLDATAGPEPCGIYHLPPPERTYREEVTRDPGRLSIAFTAEPLLGNTVHPDCVHAVEEAAQLCDSLGHHVEETAPTLDCDGLRHAMLTVIAVETRAAIKMMERLIGRRATPKDFEPSTWALGLFGREVPATAFVEATHTIHETAQALAPFFDNYDVLLTPTLSAPPVKIGALRPSGIESLALDLLGNLNAGPILSALLSADSVASHLLDYIPYTPLANMSGHPAMSVPLVWNGSGLPTGIHFMGRFGDEATLFRLAAQLEAERPWFHRRPPLVDGIQDAPPARRDGEPPAARP